MKPTVKTKRGKVVQKAWGILWYDLKGRPSIEPVYTRKPTNRHIARCVIPVEIHYTPSQRTKKRT